jgi:mRNA-degrading endonuclease RelE of RelBE toxin-antitoxin system
LWRLRVGDYRVLYSVSDPDGAVDVIAIRHRSIAYD